MSRNGNAILGSPSSTKSKEQDDAPAGTVEILPREPMFNISAIAYYAHADRLRRGWILQAQVFLSHNLIDGHFFGKHAHQCATACECNALSPRAERTRGSCSYRTTKVRWYAEHNPDSTCSPPDSTDRNHDRTGTSTKITLRSSSIITAHIKPLPHRYKGGPTRVGAHTTHNPPSQPNSQSAYIRCYPGILSDTTRNRFAFRAIESIRQDEYVSGLGVSNGYLSAEIQHRAQTRTRWPPSLLHQPYAKKLLRSEYMRFRCLIHLSSGL